MNTSDRICWGTAAVSLAGVLLASLACEGSGPSRGWSTVRDTLPSGGVLVTNTASADPSPTWTLVEELRVGTVEGGRPESFGTLKGLVALPAGGFAVLESQAQEIRVFGEDGSYVATHGGRGEGPGEFVDANGLMLDPQGRIWASDPRNGRMSVFDPSDGFVESFSYRYWVRGWVWRGFMTDDGHILKPSTGDDYARDLLRVYDSAMIQIDSVFLAEDEEEQYDPENSPGAFYYEMGGSAWGLRAIPYYPAGARHIDRSGEIWRGASSDSGYRIGKSVAGGDTTLIVAAVRPPVPVTPTERDSVIAQVRESLEEIGVTKEMDWSRIPEVKPSLETVFTSAEGNLWVGIPSPSGGTDYDVFSRDGSYLGTVAAHTLDLLDWLYPVVKGDMFLAVVTDELDVPYVIRARIAPVR